MEEPKATLRIIIDNMLYPITIEILHKVIYSFLTWGKGMTSESLGVTFCYLTDMRHNYAKFGVSWRV
jgi:hypothetical protein